MTSGQPVSAAMKGAVDKGMLRSLFLVVVIGLFLVVVIGLLAV
jgi:hypothetical protein